MASVILHLHIPRAFGSSLHKTLYAYGGSSTLAVHRRSQMLDALKSGVALPKLVTGHFAFGLHDLLDVPYVYFIPVRDPVERVWSLLRYMGSNPRHRLHEFAKCVRQPEDLYRNEQRGTQFDNSMTRQLAGIETARPLTPTDLQVAIENISRPDVMAFPCDEIERNLMKLSQRVGYCFGSIEHTNSAPQRDLTPEWREMILRHNQLDAALFEAVSARARD